PGDAQFWADRAGEYARHRRFPQAIADCSRAITLEPSVAAHRIQRAFYYAQTDQWVGAIADCTKAMELGGEDADAAAWYYCALAQLGAGDRKGYRHTCTDMLVRFGADAEQAELVSYTCVLGPIAVVDPARLVPLAKRALDTQPGGYFQQVILGAALLRAGRLP